jgi:hypothetical protein
VRWLQWRAALISLQDELLTGLRLIFLLPFPLQFPDIATVRISPETRRGGRG